MPATAWSERATSSAPERSSSAPARASPPEKISKPTENTRASSAKATTTSIRVNPASRKRGRPGAGRGLIVSILNRDPPGQPVDVDQELALARRDRDAP